MYILKQTAMYFNNIKKLTIDSGNVTDLIPTYFNFVSGNPVSHSVSALGAWIYSFHSSDCKFS